MLPPLWHTLLCSYAGKHRYFIRLPTCLCLSPLSGRTFKVECVSIILTHTAVFELIVALRDHSQDYILSESVLLICCCWVIAHEKCFNVAAWSCLLFVIKLVPEYGQDISEIHQGGSGSGRWTTQVLFSANFFFKVLNWLMAFMTYGQPLTWQGTIPWKSPHW